MLSPCPSTKVLLLRILREGHRTSNRRFKILDRPQLCLLDHSPIDTKLLRGLPYCMKSLQSAGIQTVVRLPRPVYGWTVVRPFGLGAAVSNPGATNLKHRVLPLADTLRVVTPALAERLIIVGENVVAGFSMVHIPLADSRRFDAAMDKAGHVTLHLCRSVPRTVPAPAFFVILVLVAPYVFRFTHRFHAGLEQGSINLSGFDRDRARPTYGIVRTSTASRL